MCLTVSQIFRDDRLNVTCSQVWAKLVQNLLHLRIYGVLEMAGFAARNNTPFVMGELLNPVSATSSTSVKPTSFIMARKSFPGIAPPSLNRSIWRKGSKFPDSRRSSLFPHTHQPTDQTADQTHPVRPTHFLLQLYYSKSRPQFPQPMRYPHTKKALSTFWSNPLDHSGKRGSG